MSSTEGAITGAPTRAGARPTPHARALALGRIWPEPLALALLAGLLNFWGLTRNGWANTYYSGAARSMGASWHNFLFASFDPSGVMTVDKPPLALWVQTLSVRIFGFHPLALLAPQALMGVATVLLVYDLTRRRFGRLAGFLAGLVLALTPITVAISRHNNPDALLILCSVAALWCALRALEGGRGRWFVLAGVCVGLGFETKMLVALVVLPGIAAAWAWCRPPLGGSAVDGARAGEPSLERAGEPSLERAGEPPLERAGEPSLERPRRARVRAYARARRGPLAGAAAMLLVGGAWPALVELTPASDRPWISGTADNTVLSLIFGYNGLGRIEGQSGGPQALGGSSVFGGSTGPLRLLNEALGGQAGWLLGFALLSVLAILAACRLRRADPRSGWLLLVGGAFLSTAVIFSFAHGIFHPYYVSLLAPFSAALVGAGFAELRRSGLRARILAALAVAAGVGTELAVLHDYPTELRWLTPTLIVLGALAAALLLLGAPRLRLAALLGVLALLLIAPATWAVQTLGHATSATFPAGGPANNPAGGFGGGGPGGAPHGGAIPAGPFAAQPGAGSPRTGPPPGSPGAQHTPGAPGTAAGAPQGIPRSGLPALFGNGNSRAGASGGAGGLFGGTSQTLTEAVRYATHHGGGTVAVASQSEAATLAIDGERVAGIGGFSGRESETNAAWLAQEVRAGHIRWVLTASSGFGVGAGSGGHDQRVGSTHAMAAVAATCKRVSGVSGLYDCAGRARQLAGAATR